MTGDGDVSATGVDETYVAALQHDIADVPEGARLVGVVRQPTGWFHATVDENRPELGPSEALLAEVQTRQEDLKRQGMCDEGAHNAAWEETDFERRYRAGVSDSTAAQASLDELAAAVREGELIVLVCFEGERKRCHRHVLVELLAERLDG